MWSENLEAEVLEQFVERQERFGERAEDPNDYRRWKAAAEARERRKFQRNGRPPMTAAERTRLSAEAKRARQKEEMERTLRRRIEERDRKPRRVRDRENLAKARAARKSKGEG